MKKISYFIELAILIAFVMLSNYIQLSIQDFVWLFILIACGQVFRVLRLYLVFLDDKLSFWEFLLTYIRGTAFSIITPFKLGEIYKCGLFGKLINSYSRGFILIVVDRFFDTVILSLVLLPYVITNSNSVVSVLSILVVITLLVLFIVFDESYKYLNNFLVLNSKTDRGVKTLYYLEKLKDNYDYIYKVINGKALLMLIMSVLAWSFEVLAFMVFSSKAKIEFSYIHFIENINSNFTSIQKNDYMIYCVISLVLIYIVVLGKGIYERNSDNSRR